VVEDGEGRMAQRPGGEVIEGFTGAMEVEF